MNRLKYIFILIFCFNVYASSQIKSAFDTLKFATACGASAVSLDGTEACTLDQVKALIERVNITKFEEG